MPPPGRRRPAGPADHRRARRRPTRTARRASPTKTVTT